MIRVCLRIGGRERNKEEWGVNQVLQTLKEAGVQAGRTTIADVLQERKVVEEEITI
jgi:hypothetical protein